MQANSSTVNVIVSIQAGGKYSSQDKEWLFTSWTVTTLKRHGPTSVMRTVHAWIRLSLIWMLRCACNGDYMGEWWMKIDATLGRGSHGYRYPPGLHRKEGGARAPSPVRAKQPSPYLFHQHNSTWSSWRSFRKLCPVHIRTQSKSPIADNLQVELSTFYQDVKRQNKLEKFSLPPCFCDWNVFLNNAKFPELSHFTFFLCIEGFVWPCDFCLATKARATCSSQRWTRCSKKLQEDEDELPEVLHLWMLFLYR